MKKITFYMLAAAAGIAVVACQKEADLQSSENAGEYAGVDVIHASFDGATKATVDSDGHFTWNAGDAILVYDNTPTSTTYTTTGNGASADFTADPGLSGTKTYALFPAAYADAKTKDDADVTAPSISGTAAAINLPAVYSNVSSSSMLALAPMLAQADGDNFSFKQLGGLLRVNLGHVAAGVDKYMISTDKKINGTFTTENITPGTAQIVTADTFEDGEETVTLEYASAIGDGGQDNTVIYVPLPVGDYGELTVKMYKGTTEVGRYHHGTSFTINRAGMARLGKLNVSATIVAPSEEGDITLPAYAEGVAVDFTGISDKTYTLKYGDTKPQKVFLTGTGTGITLSGTLTESTVEILAGSYASVSLSTAASTLIIDEEATIGTVTINQGNAVIAGKVDAVVVAENATADGSSAPVALKIAETATSESMSVTVNAPATVEIEKPKESSSTNKTTVTVTVAENVTGTTLSVGENVVVNLNAKSGSEVAVETAIGAGDDASGSVSIGESQGTVAKSVVTTAEELATALAVKTIDKITLGADITDTEARTISRSLTLDLNGHTYKNTASTSSVNANIDNEWSNYNLKAALSLKTESSSDLTVTIDATKGGKIDMSEIGGEGLWTGIFIHDGGTANSSNTNTVTVDIIGKDKDTEIFTFGPNVWDGVYAYFRNTNSTLSIKNAKITSTKSTGTGSVVTLHQIGQCDMEEVTINSIVAGCLFISDSMKEESTPASGTVKNCYFTNTGTGSDPWVSAPLAVSSNATMTVTGGKYTGQICAAYVFSSGGTITLDGGTYNGTDNRFRADANTAAYPFAASKIIYSGITTDSGYSTTDHTDGGTIEALVNNANQLSAAVKDANLTKITLASNIAAEYIYLTSKGAHIDLNGHTLKLEGGSYNWGIYINPTAATGIDLTIDGTKNGSKVVFGSNKAFGIYVTAGTDDQQSANVTLNGGTYDFGSSVQYGVDCFPRAGKLLIKDATLTSSNTNSGSPLVYYWGGKPEDEAYGCELDNVKITTEGLGCLMIGDAKKFYMSATDKTGIYIPAFAHVNNCTFENKSYSRSDNNYQWMASALLAAVNSTIDVDGGTYTGYTAAAYVLSSGGTINLKSGTYSGRTHCFRADFDYATYSSIKGENQSPYAAIYYASGISQTGTNQASNGYCKIEQKEF